MTGAFGLHAMGLATPLGLGKAENAENLFQGSRRSLVPRDGLVAGKTVFVGEVPSPLPTTPSAFEAFDCRNNRLMLAALREIDGDVAAARERYGASRIAVVLGTSTSGIAETERAYAAYRETGRWPAGFSYTQHEAGSLAEFTARILGLDGPAYVIVTACSSSAKVFAAARRLIRAGICDAAIVGGADSLCQMTLNGFNALGAVSGGKSRPFSTGRDGINIGEGAVAFLMTAEPAVVNLIGVGETSDAFHISAPRPDGAGAIQAMTEAVRDAGVAASSIAYINLHGTGTLLNDSMESVAVHTVFGSAVPCSSTKAMTGHMLGAAGAAEAAFLWLSLHPDFGNGLLAPQVWESAPDPELPDIAFAVSGMRASLRDGAAMLSNSFAFGGNNVSLVLGRGGAA